MVCRELLTEHLRVDFLPFRCSPCRIVYTVGDIAHVELFRKISGWLYNKAEKNRPKIEKYAAWGLFLFVAIPLPGTGAWTGALIADLLGIRVKDAFLTILAGVFVAGIIISAVSYGLFGLLGM